MDVSTVQNKIRERISYINPRFDKLITVLRTAVDNEANIIQGSNFIR